MKIRLVHIGLLTAIALMIAIWMSAKYQETKVSRALAEPLPAAVAPAAADTAKDTPEAARYRSRVEFERQTRAFLRDAPNMSPEVRMQHAQALAREVGKREQANEMSADEAVLLQIGLIQAAVVDDTERVRQAQDVVDHYRRRTEERKAAFVRQQQQDERFQQYKAREAQIVAEVSAMTRFPGNMSRDDYLRLRLQEARSAIYGMQATQSTP